MGRTPTRTWLAAAFAGAVTAALVAVGLTVAPAAHAATIDLNAYYQLVSRHSGRAIDVAGQSTADGAMVQQWSPANQANQQFRFLDSGGGYYRLQARHSGKVLDVYEWNPNNGAEIRQWPDLNGTNQQFQVIDTDSGFVKLINRFSGKALDVWEWSTANGGRISQYDDTGGWNQQWQLVQVGGGTNQTGLVGWATQGGGTTGGAGGSTVTVSNLADLNSAAASSSPLTILVNGRLSCSEDVRVVSNKTVQGVGSGSGLNGCGLNLRDSSNVIVRNMNIANVQAGNGNGDAIHLDNTTRVWIDHNDLSSNTTSGTDFYDGLVDITHGSDFVTVSWNRLHDHIKCSLIGHSDNNASEDTGHLRVTYHHNLFSNCAQRNPRVRFGNPVHVFNNYYVNTTSFSYSYSIATTETAGVLVEGNYFENITDPTHVGEGSSDPGSLVFRNNVLVNSGTPQTAGSVAGIPYPYTMDNPNDVRSVVLSGAGTGRI
jgi:pectate lyase